MITLRKNVSYAGLADVFGGKMWHVYMPDGETTWHHTKKQAAKTIRQSWSHDKETKRVLMEQLNKCKGRFPNYKCVIPKTEKVEIAVNREHIAEMLSEMRAERKIDKSVYYLAFNIGDKVTPCYIKPRICKLLLTLPNGKFYFSDPSHPLLYKSDDGNYTAVIMPVQVKKEFIGQEKITPEQCGWD